MISGGGAPDRATSTRRRWLAVSLTTLVATVSYWAVILAFASGARTSQVSLGALALGLALVPAVYVVLAYVSGHPSAPVAVLGAVGVFLVIAPPVALFLDPVTGMVAGLGGGAVVAMRLDPPHSRRSRVVGAAAGVLVELVLLFVFPPVAVAFGPAVPFVAVAVADGWRETRVGPGPADHLTT